MPKTKHHELSFLEVLSHSWKFFSENFLQILLIILIVFVPINVVGAAEQLLPARDIEGDKLSDYIPPISSLLEFFLGIISVIAIAIFVKTKQANKRINFREALLKSLAKWPTVLATNVLLSILLAILFLLLVIPGIYFGIYWAFTVLAVTLSDKKYKGAMDYSKSLVKGRWWRTFFYFLGFGVLIVMLSVLVGLPFSMAQGNIFADFAAKTVIDVVVSFFTIAYVLMYLNFEKTKTKQNI